MAVDLVATYKSIGWSPSTILHEGLRRTVDWYRSNLAAPPDKAGACDQLLG
ncbi:hypothetical protein [Bradyrhizobium sp. BR 1432]|uniref:hypothetical protein n=1 Tax=Bradyrhizobium sp. BR 1432 TaxID=3447966 RepID=UPI003EE61213